MVCFCELLLDAVCFRGGGRLHSEVHHYYVFDTLLLYIKFYIRPAQLLDDVGVVDSRRFTLSVVLSPLVT